MAVGADRTPGGAESPEPEENWDPAAIDWASLPADDPLWDALDDLDIDLDDDGPPGAPPDPSQRSWRHPSEVAAAQAHLHRADLDDAKREHPAGGLLASPRTGNGRLILTVAAGVLVVAALAIRSLDEDVMLTETAAMTLTAPTTVDVPETAESQPDSIAPIITVSAQDPAAPPAQARVDELPRMPPAYAFGVLGGGDEMTSEPIGTALRLDGLAPDLLVTSATALAGRSSVTLASYTTALDRPRLVEASVVGEDPASDIALLRIDDAQSVIATPAPLSGARPEVVGSEVEVRAGQPHRLHAGKVLDVDANSIETSASVPTGHLGSALVSRTGRVMGIVVNGPSMLATAIPIEIAARVAQNLADYGHASPNWLGITVTSTEGLVEVVAVAPLGPAERAGIISGDRLLGASGRLITSPDQLADLVSNATMEEAVDVVIERDGSVESVQITIGQRPLVEPGPVHVDT
jgi:S1-C subfamily serine protease